MSIDATVVERIYWLKQQIKGIEDEIEDEYAKLGEIEVGEYSAGDYVLYATPTKRFDPATAARVLTPEEFASILKPVPDSKLAKALLAPAKYAQTQRVSGITRKIVPVGEDA